MFADQAERIGLEFPVALDVAAGGSVIATGRNMRPAGGRKRAN
jgi:hypothetical protein